MSARYIMYGVIIITTVALAIVYCRTAYRYRETESQQLRRLLRQTLLLSVAITIAITILTLLSLAYVIASFEMKHENYGLWLANAAGIPFSMLLVPVIFLMYARNVSTQVNILCGCCERNASDSENPLPVEQIPMSESALLTHPVSNHQDSSNHHKHTSALAILGSSPLLHAVLL